MHTIKQPIQPTDPRALTSSQGSILMEAVLCLPLLILLIGGAMWLGDLHHTRTQLSLLEREAAFGPRRDLPVPDEVTITTTEVGDFYLSTTAIAERNFEMPAWTEGMVSVFEILFGNNTLPREITVNGRESRQGFTAITRAVQLEEPRTANGEDLAIGQWRNVINEPWLDDATAPDPVFNAPRLEAHERNSDYVGLSL